MTSGLGPITVKCRVGAFFGNVDRNIGPQFQRDLLPWARKTGQNLLLRVTVLVNYDLIIIPAWTEKAPNGHKGVIIFDPVDII